MGLFSNLSFRKRSQQPELAADPEAVPETSAVAVGEEVEGAAVAADPAPPAATPPSAADRALAETLVRRVAHELPAFITLAVVEAGTGAILAGQWAGHSGGALEAAAANAEIVRQTRLAIDALHLTDTEHLTDILITLRHQLHLLRVLPQSGWLLYLAVRTQDTNLALARAAVQLLDD